jgi:hypothetical protein
LATPLAMREIKPPAKPRPRSESGRRLVAITIAFSANPKIPKEAGFPNKGI